MAETLGSIVKGVKKAQYMPNGFEEEEHQIVPKESSGKEQLVEFDVLITATNQNRQKKGIGTMVAGIGAGLGGQEDVQHSAQNRVKFKVPIQFPLHQSNLDKTTPIFAPERVFDSDFEKWKSNAQDKGRETTEDDKN